MLHTTSPESYQPPFSPAAGGLLMLFFVGVSMTHGEMLWPPVGKEGEQRWTNKGPT